MKLLLLACVLCCQMSFALGQGRIMHLPAEQPSDTIGFWTKWIKKKEQQIGLAQVAKTPHSFHFRIDNGGVIIEVWQKDTLFQGSYTCWVKDVDEALPPYERIYYQQYALGAEQAHAIGHFVKSSGILQVPSQEAVKQWESGNDGIEIVIQYSDINNYYFKDYWTPSAQYGLVEAVLVQEVYTKVFELANASIVRKAFEASIPFRCYTIDDGRATCKALVSWADYWRYKRGVNNYVRKMKKQANSSLNKSKK